MTLTRRVLITLATATALSGPSWAQEATEAASPEEIQDFALGAEDAPVTMIEYASFTCPHCANFHGDQFKKLKEAYIDTGKLRFIHREVYFDRYGLWGSAIARCAGPVAYHGIVGKIYETQKEWTRVGSDAAVIEELRNIGKLAGLTDDQLDGCLNNEENLRNLLGWYQENAKRDNIRSTPTLMINGTQHENASFEALAKIIDAELGQ